MSFKSLIVLILSVSIVVAQAMRQDKHRDLSCGERKKLNLFDKIFDQPIQAEQFPYLVDINIKNASSNRTVLCSGALVTQGKVLTSMKCFGENPNGLQITVRPFGSDTDYYGEEVITARDPKLLQKCENKTIENGLALIKLTKPVALSSTTNRACLNQNHFALNNIYSRNKYYTTGYNTVLDRGLKHAFPIRFVSCPPGTPDPYVCGVNKRDPISNIILEGTPLVRDSKEQGKWTVVGVNVNEGELWGNCTGVAYIYSSFLTLGGDNQRKFIDKNVGSER